MLDPELHKLLHRLWTKAVGTKGYDKQEWMKLEQILLQQDPETAFADGLAQGKEQRNEAVIQVLSRRLNPGYRRTDIVLSIGRELGLFNLKEKPMGDEEMEKYGVDEGVDDPEALEKKASQGCPICGKKPVVQGTVLLCPDHGTEPWES